MRGFEDTLSDSWRVGDISCYDYWISVLWGGDFSRHTVQLFVLVL